MSDTRKCYLCDRLKHKDEMQEITVNGLTKNVACQTHEIDSNVTTIEINQPVQKKMKGPKQ